MLRVLNIYFYYNKIKIYNLLNLINIRFKYNINSNKGKDEDKKEEKKNITTKSAVDKK